MCGRFTVTTKDTKKIADRFQVELEKALERGGGRRSAAAVARASGEAGARPGPLQRRPDPGDPHRPLLAATPRRPSRASARRG